MAGMMARKTCDLIFGITRTASPYRGESQFPTDL